jgi:hypothetical protein
MVQVSYGATKTTTLNFMPSIMKQMTMTVIYNYSDQLKILAQGTGPVLNLGIPH